MEDYLKTIFQLQDEGAAVTTVTLALRMQVAAPSVTNMVKRLAEMGLVVHAPYQDIELSPAGRAVAIEVVRHHRLIELYLTEFLDVPWDQVHDEAERLEHVISEDLETRMADKLGQPIVDPHGHPIPSHDGNMFELPTYTLWDALPGTCVIVARVSDRDPGLLAYLPSLNLIPGVAVEILEQSPYNGTQTVRVGADHHIIGSDLARNVRVRPAENEAT